MSKITEKELESLLASNHEQDWNTACDAIKKAHNGYPEDWWPRVKLSGLMDKVAAKWGQPDAFDLKLEIVK